MITGEVCFSTQKVRYAPVINGKNIFTDAYITKRYTITYDKITGRMSYSINNASYKSNRGDSPSMIVLNARVAEMEVDSNDSYNTSAVFCIIMDFLHN